MENNDIIKLNNVINNNNQDESLTSQVIKRMGLSKHSMIIDRDGCIYRIGKVSKHKIEIEHQYDSGEWSHYSTYEEKGFEHNSIKHFEEKYNKIDKPIAEFERDVLDEVKDLSKFNTAEKESNSTDLATGLDKSLLINMKIDLEQTKRNVEIMQSVLRSKLSELDSIHSAFITKIKRIEKVIWTIELYLGVHENILQIQEGQKADYKIPITFYQQVLFMDEEVGDPTDEGLDFTNIEEFDDWILKDKNYMKLLPSEKGVRVLQVRRSDKTYSDNFFVNMLANAGNKKTYFLIRNGECFYRIWADIKITERFFPLKNEMEELYKQLDESYSSCTKEEIDDKIMSYKRNILIMQGLLERTDIFKPIPVGINLLKPNTYADTINFVYDDELTLPDGKMCYKDWHKLLNSEIRRGTRICFTGYDYRDFTERTRHDYYYFKRGLIRCVNSGIYNIIDIEQDSKLLCYFNPCDTIYERYDTHERKKSIGFYVYKHSDKVLNYDLISLEDVEYYINSRIERKNYLYMIPVLWDIKRRRIEELKWENGFVESLKLSISFDDKEKLVKIIWKCIDWWKKKVIWKRPIMKEDAKALRMITSRVKKTILNLNLTDLKM